jgi:hypothetical protein
MRHGNHRREKTRKGKTNDICRAHEESQQKLLDSEKPSDERGGVSPADNLCSDAPTLTQFFTAYKIGKTGASFCSYEKDIEVARACAAPMPTSRSTRITGKNIMQACSDVLQEEDARLLEHCTDIALTMDARSSMLTVRARMTMGNGLPEEFR